MESGFESIIKRISKEYTQAWNDWDIPKLESYLHNDVVISSPKISYVYPDKIDNRLHGRDSIIEYWERLFQIQKKFKVNQLSLEIIDKTVTTTNQIEGSNTIIQERFVLDQYGRIVELYYEYKEN